MRQDLLRSLTGNQWKWPSTPDKAFYELGDSDYR